MKIVVDRAQLMQALTLAVNVTKNCENSPLMGCAWLAKAPDGIQVEATDADTWITCTVAARAEELISPLLVNAKDLLKLIRGLAAFTFVQMEAAGAGGAGGGMGGTGGADTRLRVSAGDVIADLVLYDVELPGTAYVPERPPSGLCLEALELALMLDCVLKHVSTEQNRFGLRCLFLEAGAGAGGGAGVPKHGTRDGGRSPRWHADGRQRAV